MIGIQLINLGVLFFADQEFAALKTNTFQDFHDFLDMLNEENGSCHFNITKISGGLNVGEAVGGAD